MTDKIQTLNIASGRLERLMKDVSLWLPWQVDELNQAHREVKQVRDRLAHEKLIERNGSGE